jgi:hypothetical protein
MSTHVELQNIKKKNKIVPSSGAFGPASFHPSPGGVLSHVISYLQQKRDKQQQQQQQQQQG